MKSQRGKIKKSLIEYFSQDTTIHIKYRAQDMGAANNT